MRYRRTRWRGLAVPVIPTPMSLNRPLEKDRLKLVETPAVPSRFVPVKPTVLPLIPLLRSDTQIHYCTCTVTVSVYVCVRLMILIGK